MEQLFISKRPKVKRLMQQNWRNKVDTTCAALAVHEKSVLASSIPSDEVMLYCLLREIGILPVLTEFDKYDNDCDLSEINSVFSSQIRELTTSILKGWGMEDKDHDVHSTELGLNDLYKAGQIVSGITKTTTLSDYYRSNLISVGLEDAEVKARATAYKAMFN